MANEIATQTQQRPIDLLKSMLGSPSAKDQLAKAIGAGAAQFGAQLVNLVAADRLLQQCDPAEVMLQAFRAAVLGLQLGDVLGQTYLVAYYDKRQAKHVPQLQIGYRGLLQLALRSGRYKHLNAGFVHADDELSVDRLTGQVGLTGPGTGEVVGYFAYLETVDGFSHAVYRDKAAAETHAAKYSKTYQSKAGAWREDADKMHLKGVLSDLLRKWGQLSTQAALAVAEDARVDSLPPDSGPSFAESLAPAPAAEEPQLELLPDCPRNTPDCTYSAAACKTCPDYLTCTAAPQDKKAQLPPLRQGGKS